MRLWTIQSVSSYVRLNRDGVLYCDFPETEEYLEQTCDGIIARAYGWMMDQMERRLPVHRPEAARYPLWAWAQVGSYRKEYHPSSSEYLHGEDVMLVLDVPDEQVLLSDYSIWHCVLNEFSTGMDHGMEKRLDRFLDRNRGQGWRNIHRTCMTMWCPPGIDALTSTSGTVSSRR